MTKVVELGPRSNMTPEEALALCSREQWKEVLIIGFDENDDFRARSSNMTRRDALWASEMLRNWAIGR